MKLESTINLPYSFQADVEAYVSRAATVFNELKKPYVKTLIGRKLYVSLCLPEQLYSYCDVNVLFFVQSDEDAWSMNKVIVQATGNALTKAVTAAEVRFSCCPSSG